MMLFREISRCWQYYRANGLVHTIFDRDTPNLIQFGKYGACGVLSATVLIVISKLGEGLYPQYFSDTLDAATRAKNVAVLHFIAFLPSNFSAYALNRWLVFTPGKHSFRTEITLFTMISFLSFFIGELLPIILIRQWQVSNSVAHLSLIISSALINFILRKIFVFEK